MRITTYNTILNEDKLNILVKEKAVNYQCDGLTSPEAIVTMMNNVFNMRNKAEEYLYLIATDNKNKVMGVFEVSHGTVNFSVVSPREIFIRALLCGATNIFLCHNHPSGDCTPSREDMTVTDRIKEAGQLMNIKLIDHIVIGNSYYSFREEGRI